MEIQQTSFKVETPNLDKIFSLECFKYNDLKKLLKGLFDAVNNLGANADTVNQKLSELSGMPSLAQIQDLEKRLKAAETNIKDSGKSLKLAHERCAGFEESFTQYYEWKGQTSGRID